MNPPFRATPVRRPALLGAAVLALALTACSGATTPSSAPDATGSPATAETSATTPDASPAAEPGTGGTTAAGASTVPPGNDVAPYDDTATRDAAAPFGAVQPLGNGLEAVVDGPRAATAGERAVRASPGTPLQLFTVTLTNTGSEPVDALPWSFPVAVADGRPAVPAFDESLGVRMETFPTIAPQESVSLDVAFSAPAGTDLAVRVFDNTAPDHYVEFSA